MKLLPFSFIFLSLILFVAMKNQPALKGKIICFGDSITYGAFVRGYSWVDLISKMNPNFIMVNAGRKGRKTSDKVELLPILDKNLDADYFLLFLGVNDLKDGNDSLVQSCVNNMKWMIDQIKEKAPHAKIVLLAPPQINPKIMSEVNIKKKYNENTFRSLMLLAKEYKELALYEHINFISLLNVVSSENYVDGLHPNKKGQFQIAETVWKRLKKIF